MQKENLDKQEVNEMFLFADWCIRETLFVKGNKYYFVSPKAYATAKPYIMQELYDKFELTKEKPALSKGDVSEMLPSDGDIEELALQIEERYNECHFWKRGKIYADGFRNGAKFMREKAKGNLR